MSLNRTFQLDEIQSVAREVLAAVPSKTLCFYGEMGVGKTSLIKAMVGELGSQDRPNSPTFGLVNQYRDAHGVPIAHHFDFYRLEDPMEALDMGFEEYLNGDSWIFIEWPERIESLIPQDVVRLFLHFIDETTRSIELNVS